MQEIDVGLSQRAYRILIGEGVTDPCTGSPALRPHVVGRRCFVVSDAHVSPLYWDQVRRLLSGAGAETIVHHAIRAGEAEKRLSTVEELYHAAIAAGLDRRSLVLALGGGVVGDIAGFLAALAVRAHTPVHGGDGT